MNIYLVIFLVIVLIAVGNLIRTNMFLHEVHKLQKKYPNNPEKWNINYWKNI